MQRTELARDLFRQREERRLRARAIGHIHALSTWGSALAFAQSLPAGVYVAMNGRAFPWHGVRKNRAKGEFEPA